MKTYNCLLILISGCAMLLAPMEREPKEDEAHTQIPDTRQVSTEPADNNLGGHDNARNYHFSSENGFDWRSYGRCLRSVSALAVLSEQGRAVLWSLRNANGSLTTGVLEETLLTLRSTANGKPLFRRPRVTHLLQDMTRVGLLESISIRNSDTDTSVEVISLSELGCIGASVMSAVPELVNWASLPLPPKDLFPEP